MPTVTNVDAQSAITAHHAELQASLRERVLALRAEVQAGRSHTDPQRNVLDYLDSELLPHAAAEEAALYPAGDSGRTAMLVRAMKDEHRNLIAHVAALRVAADGVESVAISSAILALFESHLSKENDLLIPVLVADPNVALGALLGGMHELLG